MRHLPAVLIAAALCGVYAPTLESGGMLMWDEAEYATIGRSIVRGEGFAIGGEPNRLRPPLVPLAAAAAIALTGRADDEVLRAPKLAFAALALLAVYGGTAAAHGRTAGLIALVLLGVAPGFWLATPLFLSELPFLAFFFGAIVTFALGLHGSPRYFTLAWLLWGLAFLTRYTALLFAPAAVVSLALAIAMAARRVPLTTLLRSRAFLLGPLIGLAIVAPWMLRQQIAFGDALVGVREASTQLQLFMPDVSMPWYFYLVRLPAVLSPGIALAALAGLVWAIRARDGFGLHCAATSGVLLVWFSGYRFKEDRQILALLPLAASLAALGLTKLWPFSDRLAHRAVVLTTVVGLSIVTVRPMLGTQVTLGYPSFLDGMRWLRTHSAPDATVLGASPAQISWYADRRVETFPGEPALPQALGRTTWTVVTNFERGQPRYAADLAARVPPSAAQAGDAASFADSRFATTIIRSSILIEHP